MGLLKDFLAWKTIIRKERINKDSLEFPTIRLCMMNRFSKTKMRNSTVTPDQIIGIAPISEEKLGLLAKENVTTFLGILKKYQLGYKDVTDTMVSTFQFGFDLKDKRLT